MKKLVSSGLRVDTPHSDIDALLHPARAFARPGDVVADPDLTLNEKRAILASWASDACAVEASPELRRAPGSNRTVSVDAILEALSDLDKAWADTKGAAPWRRQTRQQSTEGLQPSQPTASHRSGKPLPH